MAERRSLKGVGGVATLKWVAPDGIDCNDFAPLFDVWDSGAQMHMDQNVNPGLRVEVRIEDDTTLLYGQVLSCVPDGHSAYSGYIVELTLQPESAWKDRMRQFYYPAEEGGDLPEAA